MTAPIFAAMAAAEPPKPARLNVADYFAMVPVDDGFFLTPAELLKSKLPEYDIIDTPNGYLRFAGDGAQAAVEAALFRYRDDSPLLAVCLGEPEGKKSQYLTFYVPGPKGKLRKAPRSILPVADGDGRQFILPRKGRTIIVRDKSGKHEHRYVWDGERFAEEK